MEVFKFEMTNHDVLFNNIDVSKKFIVLIGTLGVYLEDVVKKIVDSGKFVDNKTLKDNRSVMCFDDLHPIDQVFYVKKLLTEGTAENYLVYTNSPFVLQSFFHFTGHDIKDYVYYECSLNDEGDVVLNDVTGDANGAFAKMAGALNGIMDVSQNILNSSNESNQQQKEKYILFSMEIDYWLEEVNFNGEIYDQNEDDDAWKNFREDWKSIVDLQNDSINLLIDVKSGHIENWPVGKKASFRTVKIVDMGHYELLDANKEPLRVLDGYVPEFLSIEDNGYGDYLEFDVDANGNIEHWKFDENDLVKIYEEWEKAL